MRKLFSLFAALLMVGSMWANQSEELDFTVLNWDGITVDSAGTTSTGSYYAFHKGDITVTGEKGYCNVKTGILNIYNKGTMDVTASAVIDSIVLTYANTCPFAEAIPAGGSATTKVETGTVVTYVPATAATTASFSNVATSKTALTKMVVYYGGGAAPAEDPLPVLCPINSIANLKACYTKSVITDGDSVVVRGYISRIFLKPANFKNYGSVCIWMTDTRGGSAEEFELFNCYGLNADTLLRFGPDYRETGSANIDVDTVYANGYKFVTGAYIEAIGTIKKYGTIYELNTGCHLSKILNPEYTEAYEIHFDAAASKGSLDSVSFGRMMKLTVTDTQKMKQEIDANSALFGTCAADTVRFAYRLKVGGSSSEKNYLTLYVPEDGLLTVYARTSSSSATDRSIVVANATDTVINKILLDTDTVMLDSIKAFRPVSAQVKAGTYTVTYPTGAINFYGFRLDVLVDPAVTDFYVMGLDDTWDLVEAYRMTETVFGSEWTYSFGDTELVGKQFRLVAPDMQIELGGQDAEGLKPGTITLERSSNFQIMVADNYTSATNVSITLKKVVPSQSGSNNRSLSAQLDTWYLTASGDFLEPSALEDVNTESAVIKRIENGQLIIEKDGVRYDVFGQIVK